MLGAAGNLRHNPVTKSGHQQGLGMTTVMRSVTDFVVTGPRSPLSWSWVGTWSIPERRWGHGLGGPGAAAQILLEHSPPSDLLLYLHVKQTCNFH